MRASASEKLRPLGAVDGLDHAHQAPPEHQGRGDDAAGDEAGLLVEAAAEAGIVLDVGDGHGRLVLGDPAGQTLAGLQAQAAHLLLGAAGDGVEGELPRGLVVEEDGGGLGLEEPLDRGDDLPDQLGEVEARGQGGADLVDGLGEGDPGLELVELGAGVVEIHYAPQASASSSSVITTAPSASRRTSAIPG